MNEFSSLLQIAKQKAATAAKVAAKSNTTDTIKGNATPKEQEEIRDFKKVVKGAGIGRDIFAEAREAIEKKTEEMNIAAGNKAINSALTAALDTRIGKQHTTKMTGFDRNKELSNRIAAAEQKSAVAAGVITTPPPKADILKHFFSKGIEYTHACPVPDSMMGNDSLEKSFTGYLAENSIKIGSKALGEFLTLYSAYPELDPVEQGLVRATIGYVFSSATMIPHNTPNIGFADDRIVISYVLGKLQTKISTTAIKKGEKLREDVKQVINNTGVSGGGKQLDAFKSKTQSPQNPVTVTSKSKENEAPAKEKSKIVTSFG